MKRYDVVILTKKDFLKPKNPDWYVKQVLSEDNLVKEALKRLGLNVKRTYWDNPDFDFSKTKITLFRTIWDYFHRFREFSKWLDVTKKITQLVNPPEIINWNIDKHYLQDLNNKGINTPKSKFINKRDTHSLKTIISETEWKEVVLKPTVSGAGRHTYKLNINNIRLHEEIFKKLILEEDMMLQEFQQNIYEKGEVAFMIFNGKFSHAVLKKAKKGEFKVQDDFGGSVHNYRASDTEIKFAEEVVSTIQPSPVYARVDVIWDNNNKPAVSELELIEPELWFRFHPPAANLFAEAIASKL